MAEQEISTEFPFTKKRVSVLDSSIAYIDTGAPTSTSSTIIFIHGNPTSSYIWRNVIPHLSSIARCLAPDLVGFGDSGKMPANTYYLRDHVRYFGAFMDTLLPESTDPGKLFFVLQDWGSAIGFNWASQNEERVAGLVFMEFMLADMKLDNLPTSGQIFRDFRTEDVGRRLIIDENIFIEIILGRASRAGRGLAEAEMVHYRAPFLDPKSREPIYRFPNELPFDGHPADVDERVKAYFTWLMKTSIPKLMFWASPGAFISPDKAKELAAQMKNVQSVDIGAGNHYLQEENPHLIGRVTKEFVEQIWQEK
ncbi:uncharacterized protein A1O9_03845 [Exophiala aquamarina CBS 119918]|uniref:AB hydrolase-1 domain-containing protein n=1 Tax=Exophiala aquamarina CBS 119918 TaxID=1182545 RepID=A0A072PGW3_9EURO|nr:uncharacterized protein A1O9_03845 [Exophiala aquamarina CBS 119918]KEF59002.1 hypothetical protein A1O9_03845 [Exophiala aquamarina CBS 119918]